MTSQGLCCLHFTACTHHSTLQHPPFVVCLRHFSVFRWKNSRTYRSPTGLHGGITLATQVFLGSQHYIVSNSYKLARVPRRLRSPSPSHRSRTAQRLQAPCPARSRHSALSVHTLTCCTHIFLRTARSQRTSHIFMRVTYTHGSSVMKKVFVARVSFLSISLSPFSCLTHPCCFRTVTSRPLPTTTSLTIPSTCSCRTFPS